jgi:hypothetical protein
MSRKIPIDETLIAEFDQLLTDEPSIGIMNPALDSPARFTHAIRRPGAPMAGGESQKAPMRSVLETDPQIVGT